MTTPPDLEPLDVDARPAPLVDRWRDWRHRRLLTRDARRLAWQDRRARGRRLGLELVTDATVLAGCGSIVYGVHRIFEPAAFITGGACLVTLAILHARGRAPRERR